MYADRYATGPTIKPGGLSLALVATVLPLAALVAGLQIERVATIDKPLETYPVRDDPPPPPDPAPRPHPRDVQPTYETNFVPPLPPLPGDNRLRTAIDPPPQPALPPGPATGDGGTVAAAVKPVPVITAAEVDPRYAGLLQPPYPAEEQRAGRSGRVVLRVLVGTDGRVHQVERVGTASDAFFAAAERQALTRWRFKPATRDGVAIEQWKVMSLRFEFHDE